MRPPPDADAEPARLAGRMAERALLIDAMERAAKGTPAAVFVHGEAGVGKTHLVTSIRTLAEQRGFAMLWGACVRFGAATVPYAPIVGALEHWLNRAGNEMQTDDLGKLLAGDAPAEAPRLIPVIDKLIERISSNQPVMLVIDDIHWADVTSLDVLAYLVTGFRHQRLLVVATAREEGVGLPLRGWLADLRRLPAVEELRLERLSRDDTEAQLAQALGQAPDPGLVNDVYERSEGNAYLTELLVRDVVPTAASLPQGLPKALSEALLATWHRLEPTARTVVQLIATGGRPIRHHDLEAVTTAFGITPEALERAVTEAVDAGVLVTDTEARTWFGHPLTAEVVDDTLLPGEAERAHRAFIARLNESPRMGQAAELALHHELVGDLTEAFQYALKAANSAAQVQGYAEQTSQLSHAIELWPQVAEHGDLLALLRHAVDAANRAGDEQAGFAHADHALRIVDRTENPLLAARLLCEWCGLVFRTGRVAQHPLREAREALALSTTDPDSVEYVLALATVAEAEAWDDDWTAANLHATQAIEAANQPEGRAWALAARARVDEGKPKAVEEGEQAYRYASAEGFHQVAARAAVWWSNALWDVGRFQDSADVTTRAFAEASATFPAAATTAFLAGTAADRRLALGDLPAAAELVREGLAIRAGGIGGANVLLRAARLATMRGRTDQAAQHLRRAEELVPSLPHHYGLIPQPVYAFHHLASGRADQALDLLCEAMPNQAMDRWLCDEMLMWGARAAADLAQRARDREDRAGIEAARDRLDTLADLRAAHGTTPFGEGVEGRAQGAIFTAESARCRPENDTAELWHQAVDSCRAAGFRWDEALACQRLAEAMLREGGRRTEIAAALRRAHQLATDIGAEPLQQDAAAFATLARVSLDVPRGPTPTDDERFRGITKREREILAHLVAGRSYREIGTALFISEKTVSVHISNLLRKTDTTNRHELAALARRLTS
ncbi:helix-turn-helix transcriptional regulator [Tenggerimyces flavus]|uniref:AAA family ATPase n=1 Tax=Tenggerimyces flavus TaxID=1708749 RepID=A0ABV7YHM6_9ACTN|nr:LuxR family transcriptional regulator [Tenggerimyces flavus]MBM7787242.1 DNA-binding CsgD family transcriptional regulator [Tenggerimyces flavus]